jgi:hypothetical protein
MSDPDSLEDSPKFALNSKALSTNESKYNAFAYDLKKHLWKSKDFTLSPSHNNNGSGTSDISESELASLIKEVDRSPGYLSQFTHINFDWDKSCLSQYLSTDLSEEEREMHLN